MIKYYTVEIRIPNGHQREFGESNQNDVKAGKPNKIRT